MNDTASPFERGVLADGTVTESELHEAHARLASCVADSGYTIEFYDEGGFETRPKGRANPDPVVVGDVLRRCRAESDKAISYLYEQVRRNPEHRDEAEIMVDCVKKAGLVDRSYTARQWDRDFANDSFPFDDASDALRTCSMDPLGLWYRK